MKDWREKQPSRENQPIRRGTSSQLKQRRRPRYGMSYNCSMIIVLLLSASAFPVLIMAHEGERSDGRAEYETNGSRTRTFSRLRDATITEQRKLLQGELRPCGSTITTISKQSIFNTLRTWLEVWFPEDAETRTQMLTRMAFPLRYDVQAQVVCASCSDFAPIMMMEGNENDNSNQFSSYCGPERYGYDARHSGLLLLPVTRSGGGADDEDFYEVVPGRLRGFITMRGVRGDTSTAGNVFLLGPHDAPSQRFPTELLENNDESIAPDLLTNNTTTTTGATEADQDESTILEWLTRDVFLSSMIATSSGVITIVPDQLGYGHSASSFSPSFLVKAVYQQAVAVLWRHVSEVLYPVDQLDVCDDSVTMLEPIVTMAGYGDGGYGALVGAMALQEGLNVNVLMTNIGGAPLRLLDESVRVVDRILSSSSPDSHDEANILSLLFFGASYSSTNPDLPNSDRGQDILASEWTDPNNFERNVPEWFHANSDTGDDIDDLLTSESIVNLLAPSNPQDVLSDSWFNHVEDVLVGTVSTPYNPCTIPVVGVNNLLCQALKENDVLRGLEEGMTRKPIEKEADLLSIVICHSDTDEVVDPSSHIPDASQIKAGNSIVIHRFEVPGEEDGFPGSVNHFTAQLLCLVAQITPYHPTLSNQQQEKLKQKWYELSGLAGAASTTSDEVQYDDRMTRFQSANAIVPIDCSPTPAPTTASPTTSVVPTMTLEPTGIHPTSSPAPTSPDGTSSRPPPTPPTSTASVASCKATIFVTILSILLFMP